MQERRHAAGGGGGGRRIGEDFEHPEAAKGAPEHFQSWQCWRCWPWITEPPPPPPSCPAAAELAVDRAGRSGHRARAYSPLSDDHRAGPGSDGRRSVAGQRRIHPPVGSGERAGSHRPQHHPHHPQPGAGTSRSPDRHDPGRGPPETTIGWRLASESAAPTRLEIWNVTRRGASRVDEFATDAAQAAFTSRGDLLRSAETIVRGARTSPAVWVLAFFYPWWDRTGWSNPALFSDAPMRPYESSDPVDLGAGHE